MIVVSDLNDQSLTVLKDTEEGHFHDFKSKRISAPKLSRAISAFANADGGELYVGIEDPSLGWNWDGFDTVESANALLQELERLFPLGNGFSYAFLRASKEKGLVLKIEVEKSGKIVKAADERIYLRRGAQSLPQVAQDEIRRLEFNKGINSFEDEISKADAATIENSTVIIGFMLRIIPAAEPDSWLTKQRLLIHGKPTVCGLLLFSEEPQIDLPKCGVKIYRYKGTEAVGSRENLVFDPISQEGCAYQMIYGSVDCVRQLINKIQVITPEGMRSIEYPTVALHEIITNAILHRDYSLNDDVHIRIFDNRVEIESPGRLPAHITEKNILSERFLRNPKLVRLINKFENPPNKDVGEGLNSSFSAMRELKLKDPVVQQKENSVLVILKHEKLGSSEEIIITYLHTNDTINNARGRELCFIGDANHMKKIFQKMMKSEIIERIPNLPQSKARPSPG
jgi:ATP-dependent DNA helicase RecG